jgi:hypothetical protein
LAYDRVRFRRDRQDAHHYDCGKNAESLFHSGFSFYLFTFVVVLLFRTRVRQEAWSGESAGQMQAQGASLKLF